MSENKENKTHNISDPLLECVLIIASAHGIALSRDMARAGLPLENDRLGPDLLDRVAKRGNMSCRLARQSLTQINRSLLPAILILEEGNACVLIDIDCDNNQAGVIFPELGESRIELSLDDLNQKYTDSLAYLQPKYHFDARSPSVGAVRRRHWFWSVIAENKALYRDVLIAAFMMSIFALAMPLFIRIVYDRVIPNQAVHTLWALAAGVA
ncbi:MAG: cysteine peptidase family C39 domain-containing protein, partial [Desulfuromonadales bacterium]|nr:cysteine peptidase family C39 domain-containing protein [Desulfuromonadales bacterium]